MKSTGWILDIGAHVTAEGTDFRVWAPKVETIAVRMVSGAKAGATVAMEPEGNGFYRAAVAEVGDGDRYLYLLDGQLEFPDPASRYQPDGVHEASQVVDAHAFTWHDQGWTGIRLEEYLLYELHVGTFTEEGTFEAVIRHLDYLIELGITAVELLPVAQCPGHRNWGYDGVCHYAPQNNYGGPEGLKKLIDACHQKGLAVVLDVIYNHFGPEGNHYGRFGHYYTDKYKTPWGGAINFDGPYSDPVKDLFLDNALYWLNEYHVDALRLDAVDWIYDMSASHFLQELAAEVHRQRVEQGRQIHLFAENDTNDARLLRPPELGGYGLDAQWCDNFHHAVRTLLTRETTGYYEDFGQFSQLVKTFEEAFVYTGQYSTYRKKRHGSSVLDRPTSQFVVFIQNHDQVGNRRCGDRLSADQPLEKLLLAAATVQLSPYLPLIFMGEEYGEKAPFHYFVDHSDPELLEAIRKGKEAEHSSGICEGEIPDPAALSSFLESRVNLEMRHTGEHALIYEFYRLLIGLRKTLPALRIFDRNRIEVLNFAEKRVLVVVREAEGNAVVTVFSFNNLTEEISLPLPARRFEKRLDSSDHHWRGSGAIAPGSLEGAGTDHHLTVNPFSVLVYSSQS